MVSSSFAGSVVASVWRATRSSLLNNSLRKVSYQGGKSEPVKQPLKKSKLPVGRFDAPEDSQLEREPLKTIDPFSIPVVSLLIGFYINESMQSYVAGILHSVCCGRDLF
ncbi:succinate dehydrogenase assembly factor 4, mitochondrial isoform X1 [Mesocricetus auratus]|uniref:Succinate dehydrogenase assembly factor 4, mitochondrial isoform X1 n=1 Tax=Mesocricetus auratus TaxID=10036 RepID=A0A3Q0CEG3_MESAU|nr:succinate dehydrogenase assembly factor 4, mitochondrial isoform X1 [Mesocricetus auratus]